MTDSTSSGSALDFSFLQIPGVSRDPADFARIVGTPNEIDQCSHDARNASVDLASSYAKASSCAKATEDGSETLAPTIAAITFEHMRRQAAIKAQRRLDQAMGAMARRLCGWRADLSEPERKKLNKRAEDIVAHLEKHAAPGGLESSDDQDVAANLLPFVSASLAARAPFDALRKHSEQRLDGLAKSLPVYPWIAGVRGISAGGLASIVGEAGDIGTYKTVSRLWKRMGLAVLDGHRQGNPGTKPTAEDWIRHGYSGRRRSVMWNVGYALVMANQDGEFRTLYLARKALEMEKNPEMIKGHAHNRAQRYMEKRFLLRLWVAWRAASRKSDADETTSLATHEDS